MARATGPKIENGPTKVSTEKQREASDNQMNPAATSSREESAAGEREGTESISSLLIKRRTEQMSDVDHSLESAIETKTTWNGALVADPSLAGEVVSACHIDLPKNDVVESIDFERFFVLNLSYGDLRGPATLPFGRVENQLFNAVPFSADPEDWAEFKVRTNYLRMSNTHNPGERLREATMSPQELANPLGTASTNALNTANGMSAMQLASLAPMPLALYLPFRQQWKLRGYNRGRLVNSFTLAPQEEQTIEVFKWDRLSNTLESSTSFDSEGTNESSSTRRDTTDVARDVSRQTGFETNSTGKVGFKVGVVNADLSAGFNARAGINEAEKETRNAITEVTTRSTGRVRTSRTLKVVESREQGQETRTTRKLRNPNSCHTMTVAFSEILANYEVDTFVRADAARLVVLVNSATLSAIDHFDRANIRAHESPLRLALMDKSLADGFDAARYLDARSRACEVLCTGCSCDGGSGMTQDNTLFANLRNAAATLATVLNTINGYNVLFPVSVLGVPTPAGQPAIQDVRRYAFKKALQNYAPGLLSSLSALSLPTSGPSITAAQIESINQRLNSIATENYSKLLADGSTSDAIRNEIYVYLLTFVIHEPISAAITLGVIWARLNGLSSFDDFGFVAAVNGFRGAYVAWQAWVKEQMEKDENLAALRRIEKQERDLRVLEAFPLRATAEAGERLDALLAHLNDPRNRDHYRFAVWNERSGASDPTLMSLALAGLIEPTPVGMVGDQLAVPVKLVPGSFLEKYFNDSFTDLLNNPPHDRQDHMLPTPALYADAIVGACCACENNIERNNQLDLDHKKVENDIRALEVRRLTARLDAQTPLLDREGVAPPAIKVEVVNSTPAEGQVP